MVLQRHKEMRLASFGVDDDPALYRILHGEEATTATISVDVEREGLHERPQFEVLKVVASLRERDSKARPSNSRRVYHAMKCPDLLDTVFSRTRYSCVFKDA